MVIKRVGGNGLIDMGTFKLIHKGSYALEKIPLLSRLPHVYLIFIYNFSRPLNV